MLFFCDIKGVHKKRQYQYKVGWINVLLFVYLRYTSKLKELWVELAFVLAY